MGRHKKSEKVLPKNELTNPIATVNYDLTKDMGKVCRWIYTTDNKYLVYYKCKTLFEDYFRRLNVEPILRNDYKEDFIDSIV